MSKEQTDFHAAVNEWEWAGVMLVHCPDFARLCQLCENKGLVYHYQIVNRETENTLWVGSSCIMRFDIAVYGDAGEILAGAAKKKRLDDKIREVQMQRALAALRNLWQVDRQNRDLIEMYIRDFEQQKGRLLPKALVFLFRRMYDEGITFEPNLYKLKLRSIWQKEQLLRLPETDREIIWECLSEKQKEIYRQEKARAEAAAQAQAQATAHAEKLARDHAVWRAKRAQADQAVAAEPEPEKPAPAYTLTPPVNYNERAHKYAVVFKDQAGCLLRPVLYRGDRKFCQRVLDEQIGASPPGTTAQVLVTRTQVVVYQVQK
ncbi:MAG: hypothetical protein JW953_03580 [Anaerolineae bacterium]|nr:hypothetical protein [Anaerolineae bacterium]